MQTRIFPQLTAIDRAAWARLECAANPFLSYEFLTTLEATRCVGTGSGWTPHYVTLWDDDGLAAAAPVFLKMHSFGEFVFDWTWASAYQRHGLNYYPKLVCTVPFTPVTGPRLLLRRGAPAALRLELSTAVQTLAREVGASSVHWLFINHDDAEHLRAAGLALRQNFQFHWHRATVSSFEAYLDALTSKKRKNIKRERRSVADAGVAMSMRCGAEIEAITWQRFYDLYHATTLRKGGTPYLTREFFTTLGQQLPENALLVMAHRHGELVGGALCLRNEHTLYGRVWGCAEHYDGLHFETCYYTPIEYCIAHGLDTFEAGAQGEHKLARGFLPQATLSAHWIENESFRAAITRYVDEETRHVDAAMDELSEHTPFRAAD